MVVIRNVTNQHAAVCQVLAFLMATASQLEHVGHLKLVGHVGCEVLRPFSTTGAKFCAPSAPRGAKFRETSAPRDTILLDPPPSFKAPTLTGTVPELPFPHENPISLTEIQILHESYAGHMIYLGGGILSGNCFLELSGFTHYPHHLILNSVETTHTYTDWAIDNDV